MIHWGQNKERFNSKRAKLSAHASSKVFLHRKNSNFWVFRSISDESDLPYMAHIAASISSKALISASVNSIQTRKYYHTMRIMKNSWCKSQVDDGSGNMAFQNAPKLNKPFILWPVHSSLWRSYSPVWIFLTYLFMVDFIQKEFYDSDAYTAHNARLSFGMKFRETWKFDQLTQIMSAPWKRQLNRKT